MLIKYPRERIRFHPKRVYKSCDPSRSPYEQFFLAVYLKINKPGFCRNNGRNCTSF